MDMARIPEFVISGLLAVRQYGCLNMFNAEAVIFWLWQTGHIRAAEWIEANQDRFMDALAEMGKRTPGKTELDELC